MAGVVGKAFKIKKSQAKGYGYVKPNKRGGFQRNPGVATIAAINGRGSYRTARASMAGLEKNARVAKARRQLSAAEKKAFAARMSMAKNSRRAPRKVVGRVVRANPTSRASLRKRPADAVKTSRKRKSGAGAATRKTTMKRKKRKSPVKRRKTTRRKVTARKAPVRRKRRKLKRNASTALKANKKRKKRKVRRKLKRNSGTSAGARKGWRTRKAKASKRKTKRKSRKSPRKARATKKRSVKRRSRKAARKTVRRRKPTTSRRRKSSGRRRIRRNSASMKTNRRRKSSRRRVRRNGRRRIFTKNGVVGVLKMGGLLLLGFGAHRVLSNVLRDQLLSRLLPAPSPAATSGLESLSSYSGAIASGLTALIGIPLANAAIKDAELKKAVIGGIAVSALQGVLVSVLRAVSPRAADMLAGPDGSAARMSAMYGVGSSIMPHYAPISGGVGEYFAANGVGEYFANGVGEYMAATNGVGSYESNPNLYEAAAGMGRVMDSGNTNHIDPSSDLERQLTIAEAAAGVGALAPFEAAAGVAPFEASAGMGGIATVPSSSTWIPGTSDGQLWAGTRPVVNGQAVNELTPAGVLETQGGQGIFG